MQKSRAPIRFCAIRLQQGHNEFFMERPVIVECTQMIDTIELDAFHQTGGITDPDRGFLQEAPEPWDIYLVTIVHAEQEAFQECCPSIGRSEHGK